MAGVTPESIQAAGQALEAVFAGTSIYLGIRNSRASGAAQFPGLLEELSGLSDSELGAIVADNPVLAELVGTAWESAQAA